jgi:RNA polymerase sigma factor (sigma-70 family)
MDNSVEVLARAVGGDEAAWRELVARYQRLVYATIWAFRIPAPDAEDVFQETFLRLHRHALRLNEPRALTRWIIVTTRHLCLDHLAQQRSRERLVAAYEPEVAAEQEIVLYVERAQEVRDAFAELQPRCRELLGLLYFEQERPDYRAAAERLNMPIGSVGPTRARCLEQLLRRLRLRQAREPS